MKFVTLAIGLAFLSTLPQDKIVLKFNPKEGDTIVKVEKSEMAVKAKVAAGGQEQALEFEQRGNEVTATKFESVVDGKVTKALVHCREDVEEKKGPPTGEWEKHEKPLHGRKITISMKDGAIVREGADGLEKKILNKLDLNDRTSRLFPKNPVAKGDTWEVTEEDAREFLAADDDLKAAKIKLKLEDVKEIEGKRCAVVSAVLDLGGKADGGVDISMKLDAEMVVWIERGYALSVKGKGTISMKAENDQFKMTGTGPMKLDITSKIE